MDNFMHYANATNLLGDEFPSVGQRRVIGKDDGTEWEVEIVETGKPEWAYENGIIIGAVTVIKYQFIEEVRPSSKGKLRLV
ncbi:hypothetical protein ABKP09_20045 [Peribacillus frigoritolerans]|uniref:hypothetical protein n=1 Tax=Peribacillus frigoritolerans TaxID=450367 RepID=UPI0032B39543